MPAHLKGLCSVFCVAGVISMSYLMGTSVYWSRYIVQHKGFGEVDLAVQCACAVTGCLAFLGCCLLFFNVTNFGCVLCYALPLAVVVPSFCSYGLILSKYAEAVTINSTRNYVISYWARNGAPPHYMTNMERDKKCCGLRGPTDYREFIYGPHCNTQSLDVPYTCCNLTSLYKLSDPDDTSKRKHCDALTQNIFTINWALVQSTFGVYHNDTELQERSSKCKYITNKTAQIAKQFDGAIYSQGCIHYLMDDTQDFINTNYSFFVSGIIINLVMLAAFLKHWCSAPELADLDLRKNSNQILLVEEAKSRPLSMIRA